MGKQQDHVEVLRYLRDNAYITADEWATIRAHIEGLEADKAAQFIRAREWAERCGQQEARAEAAEARVRELEADAARYRWLRECDYRGDAAIHTPDGRELKTGNELDAAIDTAMQASREGR